MKLAEALILRSDTQKRIEQVRQRLNRNAKVQEGEKPSEDPIALMAEFDALATQLRDLVQRINRTNVENSVTGESVTIADAIARRDSLRLIQSTYHDLCEAATVEINRYSRSEIKSIPTFDIGAARRKSDDAAIGHRELDARIQETNWLVDLVD